ncbi:winged helix-turn-helix transcriptional regulator [Suttonella ornithocola]|uniref:winged helix-turn-helix transcriptional regulator n=1 Tax=Suttonella ornithocola TaxID=279832 RepID=UPI001B806DF9|nr:helix-turn-helix domain-containing protein [Suttonella ornithocola]
MLACSVEVALLFLANKWQMLILRDLLAGSRRSSDLKRAVGKISQKVLTANLRLMEMHGLLARMVFAEMPLRVEYTLTDLGRTLEPVLQQLAAWGEHYRELSCHKTESAIEYADDNS